MSKEENYFSKRNKFNIALKYSKKENLVSVIIFKCFLEVKMFLTYITFKPNNRAYILRNSPTFMSRYP